ncbi:MAG: GNAT family N-acetyltransferase [Archangium sp.]|nr:GNAT family N-acetyltransferase [Archangium sp.]MDP3573555.1 GNAT family N-acetyltransferase [Archangium sp.]
MIRPTTEDDLPAIYVHQRDPEACRMAAFTPRELPAFLEHWRTKILAVPTVKACTIVSNGRVAGYVSSWNHSETERNVAYWIGREFWGRGLASASLAQFLRLVDLHRPLQACVATSNVGSARVLEKCGFELVKDSLVTGEDGVAEVRYLLR